METQISWFKVPISIANKQQLQIQQGNGEIIEALEYLCSQVSNLARKPHDASDSWSCVGNYPDIRAKGVLINTNKVIFVQALVFELKQRDWKFKIPKTRGPECAERGQARHFTPCPHFRIQFQNRPKNRLFKVTSRSCQLLLRTLWMRWRSWRQFPMCRYNLIIEVKNLSNLLTRINSISNTLARFSYKNYESKEKIA